MGSGAASAAAPAFGNSAASMPRPVPSRPFDVGMPQLPSAEDVLSDGEDVNGSRLPSATRGAPASLPPDDEEADAQMAAAIQASYASQTDSGMIQDEEGMMEQALRASQMEEEARQRSSLREQQEAELQESVLMDQMREQEDKRRRVEEEQLRVMEAERVAEQETKRAQDLDAKRKRVPAEPPSDEPGRVDLRIRAPDGRNVRRAFRSTDLLDQVYAYIEVEGLLGEDAANQSFRLISNMPRTLYEDREQSLSAAGLKGQFSLLIERC